MENPKRKHNLMVGIKIKKFRYYDLIYSCGCGCGALVNVRCDFGEEVTKEHFEQFCKVNKLGQYQDE